MTSWLQQCDAASSGGGMEIHLNVWTAEPASAGCSVGQSIAKHHCHTLFAWFKILWNHRII